MNWQEHTYTELTDRICHMHLFNIHTMYKTNQYYISRVLKSINFI